MATATTTRALFVAWQHPATRAYHVVGRLLAGVGAQADQYEFAYVRGALVAQGVGFEPFTAFPSQDLTDVYRSRALFPFFTNRLMSPKRPDYPDHLHRLGLDPDEHDPMTVLARSGGVRATDSIELFAMPERVTAHDGWSEDCYETFFFAHGIRHMPTADQQAVLELRRGHPLECSPEPENVNDPNAMLLLTTGDHRAGYIPRYLAADAGRLHQGCAGLDVTVQQLNQPPAPSNQRLLCRMRACDLDDFQPFNQDAYQPISHYATTLRPGEKKLSG